MTDPILFEDYSPRFGLPMLFAGQAQKEAFVNEAHAIVDALIHCAIEGSSTIAPADAANGENWLIQSPATGEWAGQDGTIACRQAGNWLFIEPRDGMRVFDRAAGQWKLFSGGGWQTPVPPAEPTGGSVVDTEARTAIAELIGVLRIAGVLPAT